MEEIDEALRLMFSMRIHKVEAMVIIPNYRLGLQLSRILTRVQTHVFMPSIIQCVEYNCTCFMHG